jgi:hypothetical protein
MKLNLKKNLMRFILLLVGYFSAWTPYSFVAMYSAFISEEELHPLLLTLPALFAKLSIIWCPLLNLYINKNRSKFFQEKILGLKIYQIIKRMEIIELNNSENIK